MSTFFAGGYIEEAGTSEGFCDFMYTHTNIHQILSLRSTWHCEPPNIRTESHISHKKKREAHRKSRLIKLCQEDKGRSKWFVCHFLDQNGWNKRCNGYDVHIHRKNPLLWDVCWLLMLEMLQHFIRCCNTSLDVAIAIKDHWNVPIPPLEGSGVQEQLETGAWHCRCLARWKPNLSHTCVVWSSFK